MSTARETKLIHLVLARLVDGTVVTDERTACGRLPRIEVALTTGDFKRTTCLGCRYAAERTA